MATTLKTGVTNILFIWLFQYLSNLNCFQLENVLHHYRLCKIKKNLPNYPCQTFIFNMTKNYTKGSISLSQFRSLPKGKSTAQRSKVLHFPSFFFSKSLLLLGIIFLLKKKKTQQQRKCNIKSISGNLIFKRRDLSLRR